MRIALVQELEGRVLQIDELEEVGRFGSEMLKYNVAQGILGAELYNVDQEMQCLYRVRDMISLNEYFERGNMNMIQLAGLLEQLAQILTRCQEYFLDEKNLLLQCDCMFLDEKQRLQIPYLDGYNKKINEGISRLLEKFMDTMNHQDKELAFFVYGLHRLSRDSHFDLNKLSVFLDENRKKKVSQRGDDRKERRELPLEEENHLHVLPQAEKKSEQKPEQPWGKWVVSAAVSVVIGIILYQAGIIQNPVSGGLDLRRSSILVVVLMVAVYCYHKKESISHDQTRKIVREAEKEITDNTIQLVSTCTDETITLEQTEGGYWMVNLIPQDWHRPEIKIRKSPFFIGKDGAKADEIIGEGEVSRIHVKVVADAQGVFMIDQESTNGTFVNGRRLVPWERCRLEDGDMIGISSIYYKVELYS
jgi:FOG: FHA domain